MLLISVRICLWINLHCTRSLCVEKSVKRLGEKEKWITACSQDYVMFCLTGKVWISLWGAVVLQTFFFLVKLSEEDISQFVFLVQVKKFASTINMPCRAKMKSLSIASFPNTLCCNKDRRGKTQHGHSTSWCNKPVWLQVLLWRYSQCSGSESCIRWAPE